MQKKQSTHVVDFLSSTYQQGSHFGHQSVSIAAKPAWDTQMAPHIAGFRSETSFVQTAQTQKALLRAFYILSGVFQKKGHVVVINTSPDMYKLCRFVAGYTIDPTKDSSFLFLDASTVSTCFTKWVSGTLTNYKQISKSMYAFMKFSQFFDTNVQEVDFPRYHKSKKNFQGFLSTNQNQRKQLSLPAKPDVIFLMNPLENRHIIAEAKKLHIPVIAVTAINTHCEGVDYPIPCNPSMEFTYYLFQKIIQLCHIYK